jgi:hypothetical protein
VLAGEGNQQFVATATALDAHEAVLEAAAFQVVVEFLKHEVRQHAVVFAQLFVELSQMVLDDLIQQ